VHSENQLLRYEQAGGVRAAVVRSRLSTPVDLDIKLAAPAGTVLHDRGSVSADVTSWLDSGAGRFVKT